MDTIVGTRLGAYLVEKRLGQGGMATIFLGVQPSTGRRVAIKTLPKAQLNDAKAVARFEREAKVLASLQHPHILPLIDYGESGDYKYLVVPFLAHGDLEERLNRLLGPMDPSEARRLLVQLGEALDHAHSQGVVHRDLKPGNVLLDAQGNAMLADFGIAQQAGSDRLTGVGFTVGTPEYMAPEQVNGQPEARSDLYALGVLGFRLLTGALPYKGSNATATLLLQRDAPVPDPLAVNPAMSSSAASFLIKALAKDMRERFQTGAQFADAARAALPEFSSNAVQSTQQLQRPPDLNAIAAADSGTRPLPTPAASVAPGFATTVDFDPAATALGGTVLPQLATPAALPVSPPSQRMASVPNASPAGVAALAANLLGAPAAPPASQPALAQPRAEPSVDDAHGRKRWSLVALAVVVLLVIGLMAWWLLRAEPAAPVIQLDGRAPVAAAVGTPAQPAVPTPPTRSGPAVLAPGTVPIVTSGAAIPPPPTAAVAPLDTVYDDFSQPLSVQRWDIVGPLKRRMENGVLELTASAPDQWLDATTNRKFSAVAVRLYLPAPITSAQGTAGFTFSRGDWWFSCYLYAQRDRGDLLPACIETGKVVLQGNYLQAGWHDLLLRYDSAPEKGEKGELVFSVDGVEIGRVPPKLTRGGRDPLKLSLGVWTPRGGSPVTARFDAVWMEWVK